MIRPTPRRSRGRHAQRSASARCIALKGFDLEAYRGEVLAVLGDNGAGKSTLVKCISGVHALDQGEILLDGEAAVASLAGAARRAGIETVYQDLALFDNLTRRRTSIAAERIAFPRGCRRACACSQAAPWTASGGRARAPQGQAAEVRRAGRR
jgi:ABC-type uncharacterized transport system ATPase subunit